MTSETGGGKRHGGLSDIAYEQILADIMDGTFAENTRLPTEGALAKRFGVSRPVVREALARLRDDGLIASRRGSGSFVTARPARVVRSLAPLSSISDMQRCFEFRIAMESNAAQQAALRHHEADIDMLREAIAALDAVVARNALGVREDYEFHLAVCRASHNRFFVGTMEYMHDSIVSGMNLTRNLSLRRSEERLRMVQKEHYAILSAIIDHDGDAAFEGMKTHLENAKKRVFEGVEDDLSC